MPFKQRTVDVPVYDKQGRDTGFRARVVDDSRKWKALFWWCVGFTLITFFVLGIGRTALEHLDNNTVSARQSEVNLCNLRQFMISSRAFRLRSYHEHKRNAKLLLSTARQEELKLAAQDLQGTRVSTIIANNLAPSGCVKRLGITVMPIPGLTPKKRQEQEALQRES